MTAFALALLAPASAAADCAYKWLHSRHDTTTPNGWLVIEGGGPTRAVLRDLAALRPSVVSGRHRVPLTVVAIHEGQLNVTQAILRPVSPLTVGKTWRLKLGRRLSAEHKEAFYARDLNRLKWTVETPTAPVLQWLGAPIARGGDRTEFGCGPAVRISVEIQTNTAVRGVLAEVRRQDGKGQPVRWLYTVDAKTGRIRVGHGMCSGPITLQRDVVYEIQVISAVALSGKTLPAPARAAVTSAAP